MQRPMGISLLAILAFVSGSLHFLVAFIAFTSGSWISAEARSGYFISLVAPAVDAAGNLGFWIGLVGMLAAAFTLVAAGGLWVLSPWGYWLAIVGVTANLVVDVVQIFERSATVATLVGAALAIVILSYLARPRTRQVFAGFPIDAPTQFT